MSAITKIPTKKITQLETKQTPTIQQEKNIIKSSILANALDELFVSGKSFV